MKTGLICACGEHFKGVDEDALVDVVRAHLRSEHPTLEYTRDQILYIAF